MKLSVTFACLILLLAVSAVRSRRVTEDEKQKMRRGIDAGKTFVNVLKTTKKFTDVLTKMGSAMAPWLEGFGILTDLIGSFMPEDNALLNEIRKGFDEVNKRLDEIKEEIKAVKEAIKWATVKVDFAQIEKNIRLLDQILTEALAAPNPDHGKSHFIEIYKKDYDQAGTRLYISIVNNDQIVSDNIVAAGMHFTKYRRDVMEDYMRGLIALMMMSANIELAYERFNEEDRGMEAIWKGKLDDTKTALGKAEDTLVNAWKELVRTEAVEMVEKHRGWAFQNIAKVMTTFFADKYYWRHWFVFIYDEVWGFGNHAVTQSENIYVWFRQSGHNFIVASIDPSTTFDMGAAQRAYHDYKCQSTIKDCRQNSAGKVWEMTPNVGVGKVVVFSKWDIGMSSSAPNRHFGGVMLLYKSTVRRKHHLYFFG